MADASLAPGQDTPLRASQESSNPCHFGVPRAQSFQPRQTSNSWDFPQVRIGVDLQPNNISWLDLGGIHTESRGQADVSMNIGLASQSTAHLDSLKIPVEDFTGEEIEAERPFAMPTGFKRHSTFTRDQSLDSKIESTTPSAQIMDSHQADHQVLIPKQHETPNGGPERSRYSYRTSNVNSTPKNRAADHHGNRVSHSDKSWAAGWNDTSFVLENSASLRRSRSRVSENHDALLCHETHDMTATAPRNGGQTRGHVCKRTGSLTKSSITNEKNAPLKRASTSKHSTRSTPGPKSHGRSSTEESHREASFLAENSNNDLPEIRLVVELQQLRADNSSLRLKLQEQSHFLQEAQTESHREKENSTGLSQQLELKQSELGRVEQQHYILQQKLEDMKAAFGRAQKILETMQHTCHEVRAQTNAFGAHMSDLNQEVVEIRHLIHSVADDTQEIKHQNTQLTSQLQESRIELERERSLKESLQSICDRNAGTMSEDRDRIADMSKQISLLLHLQEQAKAEHLREAALKEQQLDVMSSKLEAAESGGQQEYAASLSQMAACLEILKTDMLQQTRGLKEEASKLTEQLLAQQQAAKEAEISNASTLANLDCLKSENDSLQGTLTNRSHSLEVTTKEMERLRDELDVLREDYHRVQLQHEAEFAQAQQEWNRTSEVENAKILEELESVRVELHEYKKRVVALTQLEDDLKFELDQEKTRFNGLKDSYMQQEAALRSDLEESKARYELHQQNSKAQETMHHENQLRSRDAKINRLEKELQQLHSQVGRIAELEDEKSIALAEAASMYLEKEILQRDKQAMEALNKSLQAQEHANSVLMLENTKLKKSAEQLSDLRKTHASLEKTQTDSVARVKALCEEVQRLKDATKEQSLSAPLLHAKGIHGPPLGNKGGTILGSQTATTIGRSAFAQINRSSDSLDDLDDFDFVHDTPPRVSNTSGTTNKKCKEKDKDKEKMTRSRSSTRSAIKKRKSN